MESGKKRVASDMMMEVASGDEASSDGSDLDNDLEDLDEEEEDEEEDIDELQDLLEEEEIHGLTHRHGVDQSAKSIGAHRHPSFGETLKHVRRRLKNKLRKFGCRCSGSAQ